MADTSFFGRLTKLFSSQAVVTVDSKGRRKVVDTDERQVTNLSHLRDRYTKLQKSYYEQAGGAQSMAYQQVRREIFRDYDAMDNDPIIASALDIYADESTLKNEYGDVLTVRSKDSEIQAILNNLFYDVLNVEFNLLFVCLKAFTQISEYFLPPSQLKGIITTLKASPLDLWIVIT